MTEGKPHPTNVYHTNYAMPDCENCGRPALAHRWFDYRCPRGSDGLRWKE